MSYDALFSPIKLRGLELKNRVVLPGMNTKMVKDKNDVGEDLPAYHAARAAGGCGLNIVELVSICPECHAYLYLGLYNEHHRDQLRKITDAIHAAGGKAAVQIWHGGFVPEEFFDKTNKLETPDTLTVERIHEIVKQFGYSAKLAVEAGFDALEFHGAHTYLPHEFMNPSLNKRTDEYGNQSLENRCRFNLEVIREMRKNMPEDMPLLMRLDAIDEMLPAVTTQDETVQFINWAAEAGVDAIDLSRGNARSLATVYEVPPYNLEPGFNMDNIAAIKARVNIPVIGVGRIVDPLWPISSSVRARSTWSPSAVRSSLIPNGATSPWKAARRRSAAASAAPRAAMTRSSIRRPSTSPAPATRHSAWSTRASRSRRRPRTSWSSAPASAA